MHSSGTRIVKRKATGLVSGPGRRGTAFADFATEQSALREYWRILRKRQSILAGCIATVLFITAVATLRATKMYEARSRIAILKDTPANTGLKEADNSSGEDWDYTVALDTQGGILKSDALVLQVIRELNLVQNVNFARHVREQQREPQPDTTAEAAVLQEFMDHLKVTPVMHTRLLEIRYTSPDPRLSAEIVNTLVRDYIEQNFRTRFEATMQTSDWLSKQLGDLRAKVELSQEKLVEYQKRNDALGLDEKQNIAGARLDQLNKEHTEAQALRIEKEARYRNALSSSPELSVDQKEQGIPEQLRMRYSDLKQQLAKLSTDFGPAYPRVIELKNELEQVREDIQAERAHIARRLALEYEVAAKREGMLSSALEAQKQEANRLNQSSIEYSILKRDAETNRQLYEGLLQKLKESSVLAGLRSSNIRVVDPARVPTRQISPSIPKNMALGLFVGTIIGLLSAFVSEHFDNTIRTPEEAQCLARLPLLGIVPLQTSRQTNPPHVSGIELISQHHPHSPLAESYRSLRTSILLSAAGAAPRVLLVTSCLPQEGKTTTAINTAAVLAETGARVLLVDADLRRPAVQKRLGTSHELGLSTLLSGGCVDEEAITNSAVPGLSLLPSGPIPPRPAELLGSQHLSGRVARWRQEYDYIVFDSCPVLSVTDAVLLSVVVDSVVLVVRSGATTREELRRTRDVLSRVKANLLGVVVNAADLRAPEYSSYGRHYQYYATAGCEH